MSRGKYFVMRLAIIPEVGLKVSERFLRVDTFISATRQPRSKALVSILSLKTD